MSRQARILLVDDRAENLIALDAILSSLNQILVPVRSGEQALRALAGQEFAVVLLDIMMPGMDGFETATRIKQDVNTRDVPIIFLVFVDLYLKASQLRDQAELLGGKPLNDQLSERLAEVEETLAALPAVSGDTDTAKTAARLAGRVGRLRDALNALGGDRA